MKLRTIVFVLTLLSFLSLASAAYFHYSAIYRSLQLDALKDVESQANSLKRLVAAFLTRHQRAVEALSRIEQSRVLLEHADANALERANRALDEFQTSFQVSVCYLMDIHGITIASSNRHDADSFVGQSYAFRPYFQDAIVGFPSIYMALGVTSKRRGIYYSHPVYTNRGDNLIGAAVIKASIESLEEQFSEIHKGIVLLTSHHGLIFASSRKDWLYHRLWNVTVEDAAAAVEARQFGEGPHQWVGFRRTGDAGAADSSGKEYLLYEMDIAGYPGWKVVYLLNVDALSSSALQAFKNSSVALIAILCALVSAAVFYFYRLASRDIHRRKTAEDALRESESRLRSIVEHSSNLFYAYTTDHVLTYVSPQTRAFLDCEPEEALVGWNKLLTNHPVNAEGYRISQKSIATGERQPPYPLQLIGKKGRIIWVEVNESPIVENGRTLAVVGALSDITERKSALDALQESEERFRNMVELSPFPIAILEPDGRYSFLNKKFIEVFGYTLNDIPTGRDWMRKAFPDSAYRREIIGLWLSDLYKFDKFRVRRREATVRCKDGSLRDIVFRPVTIADGKQFITYEDVTDRNKAAREQLKMDKLESLGILAGGIAHDFNNFLTGIVGNISLAKEIAIDHHQVATKLKQAEKAALRAKELTQQLLTFSRGGAPIKQKTSLKELIIDSCEFILRGSKSLCNFDIADDLWSVEIDSGQISQAISNIVINADQAMKDGGVIEVRAENCRVKADSGLTVEPGRYVKITIRDQGIGISSEHLPKIFDPYFSTKEKGNGLGLTTVHSIVAKHGGCVCAESAPAVGTTLAVFLPALPEVSVAAQDSCGPEPFMGEGKILLMDDEETIRMVAGEMLTYLGYEVEYATKGEEAIAMYQQSRDAGQVYDAVIMDLTIPGGMGGKETMRVLRTIDPAVKGIASSGYSNDPVMANFRDYGFLAVLTKPYRTEEMRKALQSLARS
ncbi:hybrid sensor histidine kinase/response regulator [Desulfoferrobacter suflitae]|uniref:hybrid sensor histidine kinase/response regulator n=1 Tax=Desulfoferrobacter suflitae TaxID=2865782 RepID=UPI0021644F5B|nr:PAS domain S-box protein [Desulfoferrobacter suflitae]MCK8602053.1 PAS domain S-box protein [Desulfoferrobacter suflitae]